MNKNTTTKENLVKIMADYLRNFVEDRPNLTCDSVSIHFLNWRTAGYPSYWVHTEIKVNRESYNFYDKEIDIYEFTKLVNDALKLANVQGKVVTYTREFAFHHETKFDRVIVYGKPCAKFTELQKVVKELTGTTINTLSLYRASVCGKRNAWDKSGYHYADYNEDRCEYVLDKISKYDAHYSFSTEIKEELDKEDGYESAMRRETEWYGQFYRYMLINIKDANGNVVAKCAIY